MRIGNMALRAALLLLGGAAMYTAVDNAAGGVATLGWQVSPDFFAVENQHDFLIRDNHARFIGGVWLGIGVFITASAFWLERLRPIVIASIAMIFLGGVARFGGDGVVSATADLALPILVELLVFPLLGLWLWLDETSAAPRVLYD